MYQPNFKSVALPVTEIMAIGVLGGVANPQSWGREGRRGSGMAPFERALVSSIKLFFGFKRQDSLTSILPSFDTVLANAATSFLRLWHACDNRLVAYLRELNY